MQRAAAKAATVRTWGQAVDQYIAAHRSAWRNDAQAAQWAQSLADHGPSRDLPVTAITTAVIVDALAKIWPTLTETGTRVRGRVERIWAAERTAGNVAGLPCSRSPRSTTTARHPGRATAHRCGNTGARDADTSDHPSHGSRPQLSYVLRRPPARAGQRGQRRTVAVVIRRIKRLGHNRPLRLLHRFDKRQDCGPFPAHDQLDTGFVRLNPSRRRCRGRIDLRLQRIPRSNRTFPRQRQRSRLAGRMFRPSDLAPKRGLIRLHQSIEITRVSRGQAATDADKCNLPCTVLGIRPRCFYGQQRKLNCG